jgi:hypothetical protein
MVSTSEVMLWSKIAGQVQRALYDTKSLEVLKLGSTYARVKYLGKEFTVKVVKG